MNKSAIAGIVIIVVIALGGYFYMNSNTTKKVPVETQTGAQTQTAESKVASLKSLMAMGKPMACTFKNSAASNMEGTIYTSGGGKTRGEFSVNTSGKEMKMHMINDGTTSYTWIDGTTTGYKVTAAAGTEAYKPSGTPKTGAESFDVNKQMEFNCDMWTEDSSMFQLPTGVTFTDTSKMMENFKSTQCVTCDGLPEAAKAECKKTLGCK